MSSRQTEWNRPVVSRPSRAVRASQWWDERREFADWEPVAAHHQTVRCRIRPGRLGPSMPDPHNRGLGPRRSRRPRLRAPFPKGHTWLIPFASAVRSRYRQDAHLRTGKFAQQSQGAVVAPSAHACSPLPTPPGRASRRRLLPLTVDVEERAYAAGKIPARSSVVRAGRPGAILTCRLTDRPLRRRSPGLPQRTQVVTTVIGADQDNPHDVLSINAASALMISGIPFDGPIGSARRLHHRRWWIGHPTFAEGCRHVRAGRRRA